MVHMNYCTKRIRADVALCLLIKRDPLRGPYQRGLLSTHRLPCHCRTPQLIPVAHHRCKCAEWSWHVCGGKRRKSRSCLRCLSSICTNKLSAQGKAAITVMKGSMDPVNYKSSSINGEAITVWKIKDLRRNMICFSEVLSIRDYGSNLYRWLERGWPICYWLGLHQWLGKRQYTATPQVV